MIVSLWNFAYLLLLQFLFSVLINPFSILLTLASLPTFRPILFTSGRQTASSSGEDGGSREEKGCYCCFSAFLELCVKTVKMTRVQCHSWPESRRGPQHVFSLLSRRTPKTLRRATGELWHFTPSSVVLIVILALHFMFIHSTCWTQQVLRKLFPLTHGQYSKE